MMGEGNLGRLVEWLDVSNRLHVGRVVTSPSGEVAKDGKKLVVDTSLEVWELIWISDVQLREPVQR